MYGARHENIVPHSQKLKKGSPLMGFVYKALNKEFINISNAIDNAHRNNKDNVWVKLTFNFECPTYIENRDVQRNVYYKIVEDLEQKKYIVKLKMMPKEAILYISWKINVNDEKNKKMEDKINSVRI